MRGDGGGGEVRKCLHCNSSMEPNVRCRTHILTQTLLTERGPTLHPQVPGMQYVFALAFRIQASFAPASLRCRRVDRPHLTDNGPERHLHLLGPKSYGPRGLIVPAFVTPPGVTAVFYFLGRRVLGLLDSGLPDSGAGPDPTLPVTALPVTQHSR
jgi:hypothetical protein